MTPEATAQRSRAKRGEGELLRVQILDAAEKLLVERGSEDAVPVRAIADVVGCTPPALYMHFKDKDELFDEVCARRFQEFDEFVEREAAAVADPLEALRARGRAYINFGLQHPEHYRLLMMTPHDEEAATMDPTAPGTIAFTHLVDAVNRCVAAGALPVDDPMKAVFALWAGVHGWTSLAIMFPGLMPTDDAYIELMCDVLIEGLLSS